MEGCPITEVENYRSEIFGVLPNLEAIDGLDRDGKEVADESDDDEDEKEAKSEEEAGEVVEVSNSESEDEEEEPVPNKKPEFKMPQQPPQPVYGDTPPMMYQQVLKNPSSFPSSYPQSFPVGSGSFDQSGFAEPIYPSFNYEFEGISPAKKGIFDQPVGGDSEYRPEELNSSESENESILFSNKSQ